MSCSRLPPSALSAAITPTPASRISSKRKRRPSSAHNPHLDEVIVVASPHAPGRLRADLALDPPAAARALRSRHRFSRRAAQLAADLGERRADAHRIRGRRAELDVHDRVPRPRALRPRHSVVSQWDVLLPLGIAPPDPEIDAHRDARGSRRASQRWSAGLPTRASARPIRSIVVHVSAGNPFRRWPSASFVDLVCRLASEDPQRRIILTSGPSDAGAAAAIARRGARATCTAERRGRRRMRRVRSRGAARAHRRVPRCTSAATAVRSTSPGRPACPWSVCTARRCRCDRSRIEARPLSAPRRKLHGSACRPCNQRRCEPGDFRCLSGISAESVRGAQRLAPSGQQEPSMNRDCCTRIGYFGLLGFVCRAAVLHCGGQHVSRPCLCSCG